MNEASTHRSPWMDADLEMFRETVRRFVAEEVAPNHERWARQQQVDRRAWEKAGELGLLLADIPEAYGGGGGSFAHVAVLMEELAYAGDYAFGVAVHQITANYILHQGTEAQKRKYLPQMAAGKRIGAIAMTEPGAGSDLQGVRTRARLKGDHYAVDGSKIFISNGAMADLVVVVAKTDPEAGSKGVSLLLLETQGAEGFKVGRILDKLGQKGADTSELFFDNVRVPADNLLGGVEGRGFYQLMNELPYERTLCAVSAIASTEAALRMTLDYTRERHAFGKPLFELQNTRFKLAEVKTQATVGRSFVDACVMRLIEGTMDADTAAMAKLWTTETLGKAVDECLQLFGGYGYMMEYPIARLYADARVQRIYGGTSEIMKEIIARSLARNG
ncbi:Acyl-CoA dehydrogenase [Variovorax sp. PBS-H4]|uniref:acyl-CoA dehydrogenase family protein n=1 Tax=Variovorax sp. PBS-H4 TaxID=434008 RepID=UPI0013187E72|nr:acyl-CoA dehydrogenase family protein [Variovorax sp. PBS-H4]VTU37303.1 Acyl-CoA dehydrogenase [Variovorax sp. PBS-H4]